MTRARYAEVRSALERSVQAAWLVASPDGTSPPPPEHPAKRGLGPRASGNRLLILCLWATKRGVRQRGCLVGIKPHQLRQVCAEAMGAALPDVLCQVRRNEGGLSLRVSSAADILDDKGNERSAKSISPVQTEADEQAFGSRDDKLAGCKLQRGRGRERRVPDGGVQRCASRCPRSCAAAARSRPSRSKRRPSSASATRCTVQEEMDAKRAIEEAATGAGGTGEQGGAGLEEYRQLNTDLKLCRFARATRDRVLLKVRAP